ncbi:MAG: sensor histidine kinase [Christensenella sp.]
MKKTRPARRISTIIIFCFSVFMVVILVAMSGISYYYSYGSMRERTIADTEVILSQVGKNIGRYISNIESISGLINTNKDIISYLEHPEAEDAGVARANFSNFLNYLPQIDQNIVSIFVFDKENKPIYVPAYLRMKQNYDITQDEWYQNIENNVTDIPVITGTQVRTMTQGENPWVISLSRRILNRKTGEVVGTQLVELNYSAIDGILNDINLGSKGYIFIVDEEGNMVYHPQLQLIYSGLKKENVAAALDAKTTVIELPQDNKIYDVTKIAGTDFSMVGVTFLDEIVASSQEMITIYIILTLIMALAAFIGSVQMAKYVTRPLSKLEHAVGEVEKGDLNANFDIKGTLETEKFAASLSSMISNVKQLMEQIIDDQEMIRTSELKALQSQINPHFLYNTLDSIVWIAEDTGSEKIKEITVALANYFRIVLSAGRDIISVHDEIEHVRSYLIIQKMRYETLDYKIEVEPAALACMMPKLLLQPIVENAIYHGVKNNADGGTIWIRGRAEDEKLIFTIDDNGRGMRAHELERIFDKNRKSAIKHGGIAMRNIKDRIELYYGKEYGVRVESVYRRGTRVTVTLPVKHDAQEEHYD